jgi:L-galactose dehydrogenase
VAGLGGGGFSRLGQGAGKSRQESVALVRRAMELGINLIDTAESYGTEEIIAQAIAGRREQVILSTKKSMWKERGLVSPQELAAGLEGSLRRLGAECIDIYHLHAVRPEHYEHARQQLLPAMLKLRRQGKLRFIGVTEGFESDHGHAMLSRAAEDGWPDVIMVGYNILNQSAGRCVLGSAGRHDMGVLNMFAVRNALQGGQRPGGQRLRELVGQLVGQGKLEPGALDADDPLGFLVGDGVARSLPEAAYRFCRHAAGIQVVLTGTGSVQHLEQNVRAILSGPLPPEIVQRLQRTFARVDSVSGQ